VLSVALASRALTMLSTLLEDLQVEGTTLPVGAASPCDVQAAELDILGQPTALQRVARIFTAVPLNQLLYYLATISYRKVRSTHVRSPSHRRKNQGLITVLFSSKSEDFSCHRISVSHSGKLVLFKKLK